MRTGHFTIRVSGHRWIMDDDFDCTWCDDMLSADEVVAVVEKSPNGKAFTLHYECIPCQEAKRAGFFNRFLGQHAPDCDGECDGCEARQ